MKLKKLVGSLAVAGVMVPGMALATNGMNMEGYGPIATAMGGASMAYDNGVAAVMNNPATLGLAPQGDRLDLAAGGLHPDVSARMNGMDTAKSGGDAYYMPAGGWVRKQGNLAYGIGVMAQGGMGTEYGSNSFMSMGDAGPTGKPVRSEVGVGRAIAPLAYDVNAQLTIAGSLELVWAGMDLQMLLPGSKMAPMMMPGGTSLGSVGGSMITSRFLPAMGAGQMTGFNWGYFDFSNNNDFSGKAHAAGWAGTLGATYKVSPQLTIGGSYHGKTALDDMEGSANVAFGAKLGPAMGAMNGAVVPVSVSGRISVHDFQWPETYGFGLAY
ncbi:MAG: outer membrane protein transport protein, partial [Methylobacter sp.]